MEGEGGPRLKKKIMFTALPNVFIIVIRMGGGGTNKCKTS